MLQARHGADGLHPRRQVREEDDDNGSHHICIDLTTVKGDGDFCTVTGQPDWCKEQGECMGSGGDCPRKDWCVCQWAFTGYINVAGGCDKVQDLVCESTNMAALKAYTKEKDGEADGGKIADALACLKQKCPHIQS